MAGLEDIRRALAANLRAVLPADEGHVSPYFDEAPKTPCLQVAGVSEVERIDFADGKRFEIVVEGILGSIVDRASQRLLDRWLEEEAVDAAFEEPLTSRLLDNGTVQTGQAAAADSGAYLRFGGQGRLLRGQTTLLVATWIGEFRT